MLYCFVLGVGAAHADERLLASFAAGLSGAVPGAYGSIPLSLFTTFDLGLYVVLPLSLPFPSRCTKSNTQIPNIRYLFSDLTMILPTKFDLFATVVFVFASDHVCFRI